MSSTQIRRLATAFGAAVSVTTLALTCASGATAAPVGGSTQASAQAGQLRLGTAPAQTTSRLLAIWQPGTVGVVKKSTTPAPAFAGQSVLSGGFAAGTVGAGRNASYGCSGLLATGGSLQVGASGSTCRAVYPGSGGLTIDLSSVVSALPVGVGAVKITANGITANARYRNGVSSGVGRIDNAAVTVCLGVSTGGSCAGTQVKVPLNLKGTTNEDVLAAVIASITGSSQLTAVASTLASGLRQAVSLRTNVQSANATTGLRTVIGLQINLLQRSAALSNLAIATAGPYSG